MERVSTDRVAASPDNAMARLMTNGTYGSGVRVVRRGGGGGGWLPDRRWPTQRRRVVINRAAVKNYSRSQYYD